MEISSIFEGKLFSFHYENEMDNEYDRLMELWTDVEYLQAYAKRNKVKNIYGFIEEILQDAEQIQDFLDNLSQNKKPYGLYFEPLQESERKLQILSFQKGKIRENQLRLYAIKIDNNCYVITGGAIKMSQKMEQHQDTIQELKKLNKARQYLTNQGVIDSDSFYELISEEL